MNVLSCVVAAFLGVALVCWLVFFGAIGWAYDSLADMFRAAP